MSDAPVVLPVVLITGCSSGIGREVSRRFAAAGFRVYASMRQPDRAGELRDEAARCGWRLTTPALDVTSDASVAAAMSAILAETGDRIDVLVNNAGYYLYGPIEEITPEELRAQLETNLIGVLRVTRAVLPAMRARGEGAIVNISSVAGRVVLPIVGPYNASKWALEALTEALRYEVHPFGIRVTCVEPGPYQTELHAKEVCAAASLRPESPYRGVIDAYSHRHRGMRRAALDGVVNTIFHAATRPRPRLRWPCGPTAVAGTVLRRFVPDALYELVVRLVFGLRRRRGP